MMVINGKTMPVGPTAVSLDVETVFCERMQPLEVQLTKNATTAIASQRTHVPTNVGVPYVVMDYAVQIWHRVHRGMRLATTVTPTTATDAALTVRLRAVGTAFKIRGNRVMMVIKSTQMRVAMDAA